MNIYYFIKMENLLLPLNLVLALVPPGFWKKYFNSCTSLATPCSSALCSPFHSLRWKNCFLICLFFFLSHCYRKHIFFSDFLSVWGFVSYHNEAFITHFQIFLVLTQFRNWIWEPTNQSNAFKNDLMIYSWFNKVTLAFLCWNM